MHDNNRGVSMLLIVRRCRACVCVCVCAGPVVVLASLSWQRLCHSWLSRGGCMEHGCSGEHVVCTLHLPRATRAGLQQECALVLCCQRSALLCHPGVLCELLIWREGLEAQEVAQHAAKVRAKKA